MESVRTCKQALRNFKNADSSLKEDMNLSHKISSEYLSLINEKYQEGVVVNLVNNSLAKGRNPVALINLGKYTIFIYKIDLVRDTSLQKILFTKTKSSSDDIALNYVYTDNGLYKFADKSGPVSKASNIWFYYDADSLNTCIMNDSIVSYNLRTSNSAISYADDNMWDILIEGNKNWLGFHRAVTLDVMFLKRNDAVYLLTMCADNPKEEIAPDLLYKAVMGDTSK